MLTAIRQWVIKTMMKGNTGVVQTLPKKEIIEKKAPDIIKKKETKETVSYTHLRAHET